MTVLIQQEYYLIQLALEKLGNYETSAKLFCGNIAIGNMQVRVGLKDIKYMCRRMCYTCVCDNVTL